MHIALNFRCPGQMRSFYDLLLSFGYTSRNVELYPLNEETSRGLRVDIDTKEICGKNIRYIEGDLFGASILIEIDRPPTTAEMPLS